MSKIIYNLDLQKHLPKIWFILAKMKVIDNKHLTKKNWQDRDKKGNMIESKEEVIIETAWQIKRNITILNNVLKIGKIP